MTQQPYYPPMQPVYPQPVQQPYPPQQAYPGYPAQPVQAPAGPPPANGTLDAYFDQPTTGGGPSIGWKDKPLGTTYVGFVMRDVTNGDVVHDTDPATKQLKYYKDQRPVFVMKVPLQVQPTPEFPEGEAMFWVRGQARDELVRAMAEVGVSGSPKAGDLIQVTLVQRKPNRTGNPSNIVQIVFRRQGAAPAQAPVAQAAPVAQQPVAAPAAPSPAAGPQQMGQQVSVEQLVQQAQAAQPQLPTAPVQFHQPAAAVAPPQVQQPAPVQMPELSPEQQNLLAQLTGPTQ